MKTGLALTASGLEGIAAVGVLKTLKSLGVEISFISASGTAAYAAYLYAKGYSEEFIIQALLRLMKKAKSCSSKGKWRRWIAQKRKRPAKDALLKEIQKTLACPVARSRLRAAMAICCVDIQSGRLVAFCKHLRLDASELKVVDDFDISAALRASLAPQPVAGAFCMENMRLCDSSFLQNYPRYMLRLLGAEHTIGASILPCQSAEPFAGAQNALEMVRRRMLFYENENKDCLLRVSLPFVPSGEKGMRECIAFASQLVEENRLKIYYTL